jgi:hypothetical protein
MKYTIGFGLILLSIFLFGFRISKSVVFKQNVTGYLKRAADANTIELAEIELSRVIRYLEEQELTTGNTSIFWDTPDNEIDFWYQNLKASQKELQNLDSDSPLERTNVLMKLRETLVDTGEKTSVTVPDGLSVYPNNGLWAFLMLAAFLSLTAGLVLVLIELDKASKKMAAQKGEQAVSD